MAVDFAEISQAHAVARPSRLAWSPSLAGAAAACLAVGVLWRIVRYLLQFPIWGDEAFILVNLLDLDYADLAGKLEYSQVAPLLFLWAEKAALQLLGGAEWCVRLVPFLAGLASLFLFRALCRTLPPLTAALAVGILAVSYYPVRHACEVKPYALDLLMAVGLLLGACRWLHTPERRGWLWFLLLWTPLALASSYPAVFVAGAVSLVLLPKMRSADGATRGLYLAFNVAMVLTFLGHYLLVGQQQASTHEARDTLEFMQRYWHDSFPPQDLARLPGWLLQVHAGNLLAYPVGGSYGLSAVTLVLCAVGAVHLWRTGRRSLLGLCLAPFGLSLLAAFLHKYPYGGSARIAQHLAAPICLLMAAGITALVLRVRSAEARQRWGVAICVLLTGIGVIGIITDCCRPYKTEQDRVSRELAEGILTRAEAHDAIVICNHVPDVLITTHWYLRRDGRPLQWMDADGTDLAAPRAWLVFFAERPISAEQLVATLGPPRPGWDVTEFHQHYIPPDSATAPALYCTRLRLDRATGATPE